LLVRLHGGEEMKPRQNLFFLVVFLFVISLFLVACERPLPGGYNNPSTTPDGTVPDVPVDVPEVNSDTAYPTEEEQAAPADAAEAYPSDAAQPAEETPVEEGAVDQALTTEDQSAADQPAVEDTAAEGETPAAEDGSEEAAGEAEVPAAESTVEEAVENPGTHTVSAGENLYRIGLLYGINWVDIAEANGITDPTSLYVGQVLVLPGADSAADEEAAQEVESEEPVVEETPEETGESGTYTVQAGDTLNIIGALLGIDWTEIAALNGIVGTQIYTGQILILPTPAAEDAEPQAVDAAGEETTYVVKDGDSIYSVAFENNITWTALVEANNIEAPYSLELGQILVIPVGE